MLDDQGIVVWLPAGTRNICLLQNVQTKSEVHSGPCPVGIGSSGLAFRRKLNCWLYHVTG